MSFCVSMHDVNIYTFILFWHCSSFATSVRVFEQVVFELPDEGFTCQHVKIKHDSKSTTEL